MKWFLVIYLLSLTACTTARHKSNNKREYLDQKFVFSVGKGQKTDKNGLKTTTIKLIRADVYKENDIYKIRPFKELSLGIVRVKCLKGTKYWDLDLAFDGNFYWQPRLTGFIYNECGKDNDKLPIRLEFLEKLNSKPIAISDISGANNVKKLGDLSGNLNLPVPDEVKQKKYIDVYVNYVDEFKKSQEKDKQLRAKQEKAEKKAIENAKRQWQVIKFGGTYVYKHKKSKHSWSTFRGQANYFDSKAACNSFGKGWRLPSENEYTKARNDGLEYVSSFSYPEWTTTNKRNDKNVQRTLTYKSGEGIVYSMQAGQGFPDVFTNEYGYRCIKTK